MSDHLFTLRLCVGQEIKIGHPIAFIVNDEKEYKAFLELSPSEYPQIGDVATPPAAPAVVAAAAPPSPSSVAASVGSPTPPTAAVTATGTLSPAARHLVETKSLDVSNLVGSLKGGRIITKEDVLNGIKSGKVLSAPARGVSSPVAAPAPPSPAAPIATPTQTQTLVSHTIGGAYTDIPNSNMRKVISSECCQS
jgi:pyruvate/2-oxoglutarate dehydrogenase complex dihydrolipoamide acyltransferase (E2) component